MATTAQSVRIGGFEITDANSNGIIDDSDTVARPSLRKFAFGRGHDPMEEIGSLKDFSSMEFERELQRLGIRSLSGAPFRAVEAYRESLLGAKQAMISGNVAGVESHLRMAQVHAGAVNSGTDFDELRPVMIELATKWQGFHEDLLSSPLVRSLLGAVGVLSLTLLVIGRVPYQAEMIWDAQKCDEIIRKGF